MIQYWPQIAYMVLTLIGLGICIAEHGKPKTGTHNAYSTVIATAIIMWLLYEGGFFK